MKHIRSTILVVVILLLSANPFARAETLRTEVTGLKGDTLQNVQERLSIVQEGYGNPLTVNKIQNFYEHAPKAIRSAIEPFGYFKSQISSSLGHRGAEWLAHFDVSPGQPLRLTEVDIQIAGPGKEDAALQKLIHELPLKTGEIFKAVNYENAKKELFQIANDQGYIKAVLVKKEIQIDLKNYTAIVILHLDTGERYYFGKINFEQNKFTEEFLRRFSPFHENEPFSSQKLIQFQQNLSNSRYFQEVAVTPNLQETHQALVPIDVLLKPNKSQQYNAGIGYGTYTGPRLTLAANLRHINDTGHNVNLQLKLSHVLSGLGVQYTIPGANPLTDEYTIGANAQKFSPKNGHAITKSLTGSSVKKLFGWKRTLALTYLRENYVIQGEGASRNSRLLIPSLSLSRVNADDLINPKLGYKLDFVVRGASSQVLSNTEFVQSEIKGKYIRSLNKYGSVVVRGDFGVTSVQNINSLPLSLQFFAGGLNSVRGFPATYFGPGRYLKAGSIEYRHPLFGDVSGAVFYDVGMADDHLNAPMGRGFGIGLIYNSIIGPIRTYVGEGHLKGKPRHFDFEFTLGPEL